jgi:hypothetical protein
MLFKPEPPGQGYALGNKDDYIMVIERAFGKCLGEGKTKAI